MSTTAAELTVLKKMFLLVSSLAQSRFPRNVKHLLGFQSYFRVILRAAPEDLQGNTQIQRPAVQQSCLLISFLPCWYLVSSNPLIAFVILPCVRWEERMLFLDLGFFFLYHKDSLMFSVSISFPSYFLLPAESIRKHNLSDEPVSINIIKRLIKCIT